MGSRRINRIAEAINQSNRSAKELAQHLGRTEATVLKWCANTSQPRINTLARIAEYLDVDIRELVERTKG